jgi:hypothetical protein
VLVKRVLFLLYLLFTYIFTYYLYIYLLITYIFTHSLTPCSRAFIQKLTCSELLKKFPLLYGTRRFIATFTSARHLSLSWASSIQSIPPHHNSWRFILIVPSYLRLGLPCGLFHSSFPTKTLYTTLLSTIRATCPSHLILLDFITRIIFGKQYFNRIVPNS